jgi:transglutaminase-like putative cysteine protease
MNYDVRLVMSATYQGAVPFARQVLRLQPVDLPGQNVRFTTLRIEPEPVDIRKGVDFFGNNTIWAAIETPHSKLIVRTEARVDVTRAPAPDPQSTPAWEDVRDDAAGWGDLSPTAPVHFLYASRHVGMSEAIGAYAGKSFTRGRPVLAAAADLMTRIHTDFAYVSGVTTVSTPPDEVFTKKRGVCQDFAHVMIAGLRWLGLPAAYVSGYLRTLPPPGKPRLEGVDATHAWVSVWCGAEAGWVGLDPTNALIVAQDHVVLAIGRDYADVAPLDGVVLTHGKQNVDVAVDVAPAT